MRPLWEMAADRTGAFDRDAVDYDRYRPRYPDALFDELLGVLPSGTCRAIEIGAGTGIATMPLVERGLRVLAIESGPAMADLLVQKVGGRAEVVIGRFEDWEPDRRVELVVACNAWHWVDPSVGVDRVAEVLTPGGVVCLVWTEVVSYGSPVLDELLGQTTDRDLLDSVMGSRLSIEADVRFAPVGTISHPFATVLDADTFVAVSRTYGGSSTDEGIAAVREEIVGRGDGAVTKSERATAFLYRLA